MFASSARVRPCSALLCFSSSGRSTTRLPSACLTLISGCTSSASLPLGPSTLIFCPAIATFALPTGTGFFPIRLMTHLCACPLADGAEKLATDILLARPAIAHHALGRAHDRDAHPVEDAREVADAAV